ncbi:GntR family transcriptional regulator [Thermogemmatispora tikiterensis]|uniref:HTH gntR-type domain-containing protein n=1 Tax=Thermogemmatispora tikiterensis TaxID=1825093 RepID=A0A328VBH9_9CHLR|nr:GntR family transcriptional regulator [Thermogemmatispora tikiterensis]RAQ94101.1 hypothetical protein A4R35_01060 [Thermogemmatispora tikiterensis]
MPLDVFQPVQGDKRSLEGRSVSYIRDLVLVEQGMLAPGKRLLPPERELAVHLRVSCTALWEALQTLAAPGLVVARRGRGSSWLGALRATEQRQCYAMRSLVLLEALRLPDLPAGGLRTTLRVDDAGRPARPPAGRRSL